MNFPDLPQNVSILRDVFMTILAHYSLLLPTHKRNAYMQTDPKRYEEGHTDKNRHR